MASNHRMFSNAITQSARFLRMPPTSRLLYYDLGMQADDDGVVEAFTVMRLTGAADDDLRMLVVKGFVRVLNDDLVTLILDWRQNNVIKKDRYRPSIYAELLPPGSTLEPSRNQYGTESEPSRNQTGTVRQDKTRQVKTSQDKPRQDTAPEADTLPCNSPNVAPDALVIYATSNLTTLSPNNLDELLSYRDTFSDTMIQAAIDETLAHGSRAYAYTHSILERWMQAGYRTIGEIKAAEEKRKSAIRPDVKPGNPMITRSVSEDEFMDTYTDIMHRPTRATG